MTKKTANPRQKCKAAFTLSVQGKRSRTAIGNAVASSPLQSEREGVRGKSIKEKAFDYAHPNLLPEGEEAGRLIA